MKKYHKQKDGKRSGEWVACRAAKCRLGGDHISEFQLHQEKNRNLITKELATASDAESLLAVSEVKAAMERSYVPATSYGYQKALENKETEKAEAARLIAEGTPEEMESFVQNRINSELFTELLNKREENKEILESLKADRDLLAQKWETDPDFLYEDVRQKELSLIDANEESTLLGRQINEYKDVAAPVVAKIADLEEEQMRANGEWAEYTDNTLNNMSETATYDSGTREWLEQRQEGVGGSDVGPIIRAKGSYSSRDDIMQSKLQPITDEQVNEQAKDNAEFTGPLGRGNAWEKRIFLQVQKNNPDENITFCKTSWRNNDNQFQTANFDGLMTDENGHPDGIVEIKTASVASKWGPESAGLDGVPATYRTQALWYAQAAGFKRGKVAVVIDDREYREYNFVVTPEIEAEANRNLEAVKIFNTEVKARKEGTWVEKGRARGFSQEALNSSLENKGKKEIFSEVAAMRGVHPQVVEREFKAGFTGEQNKDKEHVHARLRSLYVETASQKTLPDYVGVDLETAGSQPSSGYIIEFGASVRSNYSMSPLDRNDTEKHKISKLYGVSKKGILARGTGQSEVHGITTTQIAKKRQFLNPNEGASVLRTLKTSGIMLAHNASFERRWLSTHVPGFADAVKKGQIRILDSMKLSRRLLTDVPNDKLSSFTARYNVPYTGAHRAYNDSEMMSYAYERMLRELRTGKKEL